MQKLRHEVEPLMSDSSGTFSNEKIAHLPHLNGVINEALRLLPAVPTAIIRMTPPGGISIDGIYIPGNMNVWSPQYAIGRSTASSYPPTTPKMYHLSFYWPLADEMGIEKANPSMHKPTSSYRSAGTSSQI